MLNFRNLGSYTHDEKLHKVYVNFKLLYFISKLDALIYLYFENNSLESLKLFTFEVISVDF